MDLLTMAQEKTFDSAFGAVTVKVPSLKKRLEIHKRMQKYAEALPLGFDAWDLVETMATLDVAVTDAPKSFERDGVTGGWDYDKLFDEEALLKLGKEVKVWLDSFRRRVQAEPETVGKD